MAIRADITERKMLEDNLRKLNLVLEGKVDDRTRELVISLEREKELNEIKSRFVSMASHEFRTPLSAILSSVSLIESYNEPEQLEKRLRHVERIKSSVKNLTEILNDFLSLDKLEQGKVIPESSSFDLAQFLNEIVDEMDGMLKRKNQQIKYIHNGENEIQQDKKILRNVMFNLLSNSSKYSGEDKEIDLTAEVNSEYVRIAVKDNGIGIPIEDQKYLFGKFFRAKNTGSIQGTGLGLSIVKHYVELLDGTIDFTSRENEGTIFTVKIPRNNSSNKLC
jgi:signal transduction histidine kinase